MKATLPSAIDAMPLQYFNYSSAGTYAYYWNQPITTSTTVGAFGKGGGLEFHVEPVLPNSGTVVDAATSLGERATRIDVSRFAAALVWHDPDRSGLRRHGLYWADDASNYSLIGDRQAFELVNLGREITCAG